MRRYPYRANSFSSLVDSVVDAGTELATNVGREALGQGAVEGQLALLEDKIAPHYPINASYVYCDEDASDKSKCASVIWFARLDQYDFPKTTKLKELNDLLAKVNISQRLTQVNDGALRKLRARMFYDTANTYNLLDVTEPEALDIAKKGFSRVESARSVKIKDKTYRRELVLGLAKKLANAVEIIDTPESSSYARMLEKMTAIEDAFLNFPSFKTNLLSLPLAKHLAARVGLDFSVPKLRIYLNPERTEFVEYTDANKQVQVKSKDVNEKISADSALLPPEKLAEITPKTADTEFAKGSGTSTASDTSPWYKTWWGISLIAVGTTGAAYGIYKVTRKSRGSI